MTYEITDTGPRWKDKAIKGADAASFEVLTDTLARDAAAVYMLGKPAKVDAASFKLLGAAYARDAGAVYYLMETKLKPVKHADPASFEALGGQFGRDAAQGFFREKRLRISKHGSLDQLTAFGHVYAHDGAVLYFTTKQLKLPAGAEVNWAKAQLKWMLEDGYDLNVPPLVFFDGDEVWYADKFPSAETWTRLDGADFETCDAVPGAGPFDASYVRDARTVWFKDGSPVEGASPDAVSQVGSSMLSDGERLWNGAAPLEIKADESVFIRHQHAGPPDYHNGDLVHLGDRVSILDPDKGEHVIAKAAPETRPLNEVASAALRPLFGLMFTVLENFLPIVNMPGNIAERLNPNEDRPSDEPKIEPVEPPDYAVAVDDAGLITLTLTCGAQLSQPASCWYTLGCHFWCHARGFEQELIPYPSTGSMLPRGTEMQHMLLNAAQGEMWKFASALFLAGAEQEARVLGHDLFYRHARFSWQPSDLLPDIADIPQALASEFDYNEPRHGFTSTTNLAVSRHILAEGFLEADNFRDRLDVLSVLHGTILSTNKRKRFMAEIIPPLMDRYDAEPLAAVRERIAFVLEAACIACQVDVEVSRQFHSKAFLELIDFCIARGIHTRFNRARRAETLWALDEDDEGDTEASAMIEAYGDDCHWPGVYCYRYSYRTTRLWLLAAKTRICWRPTGQKDKAKHVAVHKQRLSAMEDELAALLADYGKAARKWDEVDLVQSDLQRYREGIAITEAEIKSK